MFAPSPPILGQCSLELFPASVSILIISLSFLTGTPVIISTVHPAACPSLPYRVAYGIFEFAHLVLQLHQPVDIPSKSIRVNMSLLFLLLQDPVGLLEFFDLLSESVHPDVVTQVGRAAADDRIELLDLTHNAIELVPLLIHSLLQVSQLCTVPIHLLVLPATAVFEFQREHGPVIAREC